MDTKQFDDDNGNGNTQLTQKDSQFSQILEVFEKSLRI